MIRTFTYLYTFGCILLFPWTLVSQGEDEIQLLTEKTQFEAGNTIVLKFSNSTTKDFPNLYCSNSYGSVVVIPVFEDDLFQYHIPQFISNKSGYVSWKLLSPNQSVSGTFKVYPKHQVSTLETYLGPPSIEAGGSDYTMLVVIPTDALDNPLKEGTSVLAKHQFLSSEETDSITTHNLIAYKNIYSKAKTGRMLIASESLGVNSKEFDVNVMAAIPTDFTISVNRHHDYADGNQITAFSTSSIRDQYDNAVSDGTYVEFFITNKQGNILKASGTTIKGVATAKMIHPDHEEQWQVKAIIDGMAESQIISLKYKQVISNFDVSFSKNNRKISVGPLQSFMKQMIPDGLQVNVSVHKNGKHLRTISGSAYQGYAAFNLKTDIFPHDTYDISIIAAGIKKTFKDIKLW